MRKGHEEGGTGIITFTLKMLAKRNNGSLHAEGWIEDGTCLMKASGQKPRALKEVLVEPTLGQSTIYIWVFVKKITDKFILGSRVLQAYDAAVDLNHHVLWLGEG
jgi:hypothetical protein